MADIDIEAPGGDETDLRAAISKYKLSFDSITLGASPVAASAETDLTFVTTAGTGDTQTISLALPANPETKIGKVKRFILAAKVHADDAVAMDLTNFVASDGTAETGDFFVNYLYNAQSFIEVVLVSTGAAIKWQAWRTSTEAYYVVVCAQVLPTPCALGSDLTLTGGEATSGNGGNVNIVGGQGTGDGGDVTISLQPGGSGRQGLFRIGNLPTANPTANGDALWASEGVLVVEGSTPLGNLIRVTVPTSDPADGVTIWFDGSALKVASPI